MEVKKIKFIKFFFFKKIYYDMIDWCNISIICQKLLMVALHF